ncbi:hypothetical protein KR018_008248 [Drosophila ironensis]|nr:hypothetical protein KR018_008248 [Drosophila ironensis]
MWKRGPQAVHRISKPKKTNLLHRWCVLGVCWATYLFYRGLVIGQIKYDVRRGKMIIQPRNPWTRRIALIAKIVLASFDMFGVAYIVTALLPISFYGKNEFDRYNFFGNTLLVILCYLEIWNVVRLICWLKSVSWNRSFVRLANEVICIGSLMEKLFPMGKISSKNRHLYFFLVIQFPVLLLEVYNCLPIGITNIITILLQILYNAYAVYQLILLSWVETLNRFLESYKKDGIRSEKQCHRFIRIFHLYSRIADTHKHISKLWLPVSSIILSSVVDMATVWSQLLYCIIHDHSRDRKAKWHLILNKQLGVCFMPLLRILFVALCNDRLANVENVLRLNLLVVDLNQLPCKHFGDTLKSNEVKILQICFDLQLHVQPLKNKALSDYQVCGGEFFLQFCVCVLLNALGILQFMLEMKKNELSL